MMTDNVSATYICSLGSALELGAREVDPFSSEF